MPRTLMAWTVLWLLPAALPAADLTVASPDGSVQLLLFQDGGRLEYAVTFQGKPVVERSALGITVDGMNLGDGVRLENVERYETDESYDWYGKHATAVDRSKGVRVALQHERSRTDYRLEARAYDDGVAFRHVAPGQGERVPDEATTFRLPEGSLLWYHDFEDHYEGRYFRKSLRAVPPDGWAAPPLTYRLPDGAGYASITEGALTHYSGMGLQADQAGVFHARLGHAIPASYPFRLRYAGDVERLKAPASIRGTITTPWRIVMVGADLNALVKSDIIHNLAPPPDPGLFPQGIRTAWIKPGRAVWSYLDGGTNTLEGMKEFSRLAAELGFEYNLLEGFWARWPEKDLKELVDYSRDLGVGLFIWRHSNQLRDPQRLREFFEMCRRTGVVGAKIDFFDHEHKEVIDFYEAILKTAAEYQILIDFHGSNKPTGMERTYPNLVGLEGIRGMEMREPYAELDVTLPFTRMLAGLADYTPTHFGRRLADTTWAHQVANAVLLQAPFLVYAAHPANILANPTADMIKQIPSVWDETIALPVSEVGEVAAFARRKGDTWFLAVTNGIFERTVRVDLTFLDQGWYKAQLIRDTDRADEVRIDHQTLRAGDSLHIRMRSGGGFVGRFEK